MKIVSVFTNNPLFIELQYNSIKKYVRDSEPEIVIFNDAKSWADFTNCGDLTMKQQITDMCKKLNIKCINIPNDHHKYQTAPSIRHADSVNYITKFMFSEPDAYMMLDSDMFFVDYFDNDIKDFEKYSFCYVNQSRTLGVTVNYPWPNLFYIDSRTVSNKELINWNVDVGLDSGGKCALWLSKLEPEKKLSIIFLQTCLWSEEELPLHLKGLKMFLDNDTRNINGKYFAELYHGKIFHYRAASNWMNNSSEKLTNLLYDTLTTNFA